MRNISQSYKTYWVYSVLREGVIIPLPSLRPLASFSPLELGIAARRAVYREHNLSLQRPKFHSYSRLIWPFSRPRTSAEGNDPCAGANLETSNSLDVFWIISLHHNGEWYFTFSKDFILRVLHLRTATWVLEEKPHELESSLGIVSSQYAIKTLDDFEARVAVVITEEAGELSPGQTAYSCVLSTYRISLDTKCLTASITPLAVVPLPVIPIRLDLAGDYVVLIEEDVDNIESGVIYVVEWKTGKVVDLPPVRGATESKKPRIAHLSAVSPIFLGRWLSRLLPFSGN